jgi:hypothetical protein
MSEWYIFWKKLIARYAEPVYTPLEAQALLLALYLSSKDRVVLAITLASLLMLLQYVINRKKSAA